MYYVEISVKLDDPEYAVNNMIEKHERGRR